MLVAAGGYLSNYNGSFAFEKPGDSYPDDVPYTAMRVVNDNQLSVYFYLSRTSLSSYIDYRFQVFLVHCKVSLSSHKL